MIINLFFAGDFALIDNKTFEVVGTWSENESDKNLNKPQLNYDFWYQPRQNLMISTEWGSPNKIINGFDPNDIQKGTFID